MSLARAADYFSSARLQLIPATYCTNTYTTDLFLDSSARHQPAPATTIISATPKPSANFN
jgi:hypothetical protein